MNRAIFFLSIAACSNKGESSPDAGGDPPTDADADTDSDADSDADTDADQPDAVDEDGDGSSAGDDCDDADPDVYPGAPDICGDERVTDCDRTSDDGLVTVNGTDTYDDLRDALAAATADAELVVCPGTWNGPFQAGVAVRLLAFGDATTTILDGRGQDTTLSVPAGSEVIGFTVRGGAAERSGGGIRLTTPGALRVEASVVTGNSARFGGGLFVTGGSVATLVDTTVVGNQATDGGGIHADPGSTVDLTDGSSVSSNSASGWAGGVMLDTATLVGGTISDNESYLSGGGIFVYRSTIEGTVVSGNRASSGGGVAVDGIVTVRDTTISGNRASFAGGGLAVESGDYDVNITIVGGTITSNDAVRGGGVFSYVNTTFDGTGITDNTADDGAGLYINGGQTTMIGGSLLRNVAQTGGGGVYIALDYEPPTFDATEVDFADNAPTDVSIEETGIDGYGSGASFSCGESGCTPAP